MNNIHASNPCTRCGKARIDSRTWVEEIDTFFGKDRIVHTDTVCPDPECQAIVQKKIDQDKERTEAMKLEREERMKKKMKKPVVKV